MTLPIVLTTAGRTPQAPADLRAQLVALVAADSPDYTANLPGSLIEDLASTATAAVTLCDSAVTELINSLTPYGANAFILRQLGQVYGVPLGTDTNTSVYVEFSGPPGYVVAVGFTVSDGTYQYVVQNGGIVEASGRTEPLYCIAALAGSFAVPAGTVTQLVTSVPSDIDLSVANPLAGIPASAAPSEDDYRAQVLAAGLAPGQGMPSFLRKALSVIPGVQARLIAIKQVTGGGWEVICGGGDPYLVANAIFNSLFDISILTGSAMPVEGITQANPGVVTTVLNHGFTTGQVITMAGVVGMVPLNNVPLTITVIDEKNFSVGEDTTAFPAYVSGGVLSPNLRNVVVSINDYPDVYTIPFVNPPQQAVNIIATWNTQAVNFVSAAAVAQLAVPALVNYVNSLQVGTPINLFELQAVFQAAVATVLPAQLLTRMVFAVSINGVGVAPSAGTGIIAGDPESYFLASTATVSVLQG